MTIPLGILAVHAAAVGFLGSPFGRHRFFSMLRAPHEIEEGVALGMVALSAGLVLAGWWLAWAVGVQRRRWLPAGLQPAGQRLYTLAANKYYVDELYDRAIIRPFVRLTQRLSQFDRSVIDGAVDHAGRFGWLVSRWKESFDRLIVDRVVNGVALTVRGIGAVLRWLQTGVVHHYLLAVVITVVALSVVLRR
jgi:NADH:ubiquinone oxidoreductase subunit 5 (subunit L)/multisubunit Na+/H+ antiporter MnhA subunit